jgi:hypothetical protein
MKIIKWVANFFQSQNFSFKDNILKVSIKLTIIRALSLFLNLKYLQAKDFSIAQLIKLLLTDLKAETKYKPAIIILILTIKNL